MRQIDIQVHDCAEVVVENCEQVGRAWRELQFYDKEGRLILELTVWGHVANQLPVLQTPDK